MTHEMTEYIATYVNNRTGKVIGTDVSLSLQHAKYKASFRANIYHHDNCEIVNGDTGEVIAYYDAERLQWSES